MISHVKFVSIAVSDQQRALEFYTEKLGFRVTTDQPMGAGQRWLELEVPGATTRVVLVTPPGQEDRIGTFSNLVFACADIEQAYQEMLDAGVEFAQPLKREPWGAGAIFKDPDGNQFLLATEE